MASCRETILALLQEQRFITSRDVQARAGVSATAAWKQLRLLLDFDVLRVEGAGRAIRYRRTHCGDIRDEHPEEPALQTWIELMRRCPSVYYLRLAKRGAVALQTRAQARVLLRPLPSDALLFVDCSGLSGMGEPFARALFASPEGSSAVVLNACPEIAAVIAGVRGRERLLPRGSDYPGPSCDLLRRLNAWG